MQSAGLTQEQQSDFLAFQIKVATMDREQAIAALVETFERMVYNEAKYLPMIRQAWGMERGYGSNENTQGKS